MAPSVLTRVFDRGRAGARRLRGRAAGGEAERPLPTAGAEAEGPLPTSGGEAERPLPTIGRADAREGMVDRAASREELAAVRRALVEELDRLALREGSTGDRDPPLTSSGRHQPPAT